ncbi:MAG TPA: PEGA domain-containing protein [Polyangiaceae bacterium]|nr:PEGA domain-containing protein [Polyangiaceae bacterium]
MTAPRSARLRRIGSVALVTLAAFVTFVTGAACTPMASQKVSLRMKGNVRDASVTIDDQYVGALAYVASRGVALPPGTHRITVEKTGYFPWDRVVEASEAPIHLDVVLTKIPD